MIVRMGAGRIRPVCALTGIEVTAFGRQGLGAHSMTLSSGSGQP
jgi:hypothetical protein